MLGFLFEPYRPTFYSGGGASATDISIATERVSQDLNRRIESLELACAGLWELLKAKNGYTGDPPQSRADMLKNRYFQDVRVHVFAKHSASQWVEIATLDIPRQLLAH